MSVYYRRTSKELITGCSNCTLTHVISVYIVFSGLIFFSTVLAAQAQNEVTVTITRIEQLECVDDTLWFCGSGSDFYAKIAIDDSSFESDHINDVTNISPDWSLRQLVNGESANIRIEVWDYDGGLRFQDDHVDVTPNSGRNLELTLSFSDCSISGSINGSCNTSLTSSGTSDDRARISFRVDVTPARLGEVEVILERLTTLECVDDLFGWCPSEADYYARVAIDATEKSNLDFDESSIFKNQDDAATIWRFLQTVNLNRPTIPIEVRVMDEDGFLNPDDTVDVQPGSGRILNLDLEPTSCVITGDAMGRCGDLLEVGSRIDVSGNESDRARLQLRVQLHNNPRFFVRCLHKPIWPQAGDTVTFVVDTLDANMRPIIASDIRLRQPAGGGGIEHICKDASTCSIDLSTSENGVFDYGCEAQLNGFTASTSTRISIIGPPAVGRAVPVLRHRPEANAIDMVFIPDDESYSGSNDSNFRNDVHNVIRKAFLSEELFLRNGDRFNFWIAQDTGDALGYTPGSVCRNAPSNWTIDYGFSDSGIILHTQDLRDCAFSGIFSAKSDKINVVKHETGHSPFGLADEYCCDGGYFENPPNANLYGPDVPGTTLALTQCQADQLAGLRDSCIGFTSSPERGSDRFYRLDHAPVPDDNVVENDLLVDNRVPRPADERRIQAVIDSLP